MAPISSPKFLAPEEFSFMWLFVVDIDFCGYPENVKKYIHGYGFCGFLSPIWFSLRDKKIVAIAEATPMKSQN